MWQRENRERRNATKRKLARRDRALIDAAKARLAGSVEHTDVMRRALIDSPKDLATEAEAAAYYRGYVAGARRPINATPFEGIPLQPLAKAEIRVAKRRRSTLSVARAEDERFERLKDLPHRIASERASKAGIGYEEALSAAYEGVLLFIRSKEASEFCDLEHERKSAAKKIRWHIIDYKRTHGGRSRLGNLRWVGGPDHLNEEGESMVAAFATARSEDKGEDLWREIQVRIQARPVPRNKKDVRDRLELILHRRIQGYGFKEIGAELSLTEARVCQILEEERPWLEEHILPLCGSVALAS